MHYVDLIWCSSCCWEERAASIMWTFENHVRAAYAQKGCFPCISSMLTSQTSLLLIPQTAKMFNILSFLLLPAVIRALPTTSSYEDVLDKRAVCSGNTATTRSQWCNYNLQTNYYNTYPNTGVVRSYTFNIQNITLSPDGVPRMVQAINGQIPGPAIHANWGDTIQVTVNNQVQSNGKFNNRPS